MRDSRINNVDENRNNLTIKYISSKEGKRIEVKDTNGNVVETKILEQKI